MPEFLRAMGRKLANARQPASSDHRLLAREHGRQRWELGWNLGHIIHDYGCLRRTILESLENALSTPLTMHEIMTIGEWLDDASTAAVVAFTTHHEAALQRSRQELEALNQVLEQRVAERTAEAERRTTQLRRLTATLVDAEQRERRRLAIRLHDELQQLLAAIKIRLDTVERHSPEAAYQEILREAAQLVQECIQYSRALSIELSPPVLYDLGLTPALAWLAKWMADKQGLTVEVDIDPQAEPVSEDVRTCLFFVVRELLFNVVQHAGVQEATVRMTRRSEDAVEITVSDQGVGFAPRNEVPATDVGGFGLFQIRERLEGLGGTVEIKSGGNQGTTVVVTAPRQLP